MNNNYRDGDVHGDPAKSNPQDTNYTINKIKEIGNDEDQKTNSTFAYESNSKITGSYFCFECGAIMTTKEDKRQHELFETNKKSKDDEMDYGH
jgi:hypothetical protein